MANYPANYSVISLSSDEKKLLVSSAKTLIIEGNGKVILNVDRSINVEIIDLTTDAEYEIHLAEFSYVKVVTAKFASSTTIFKTYQKGEESNVEIYGTTVAIENQNIEIFTYINHNSSNSQSTQFVKSIGAGHSTTKFEGKIYIAEGTRAISAYQQNKNILLSSEAQIKSNPWLEIYADDVKCSHGSTTGMLNEDEIFYMRQRGISLNNARKLQIEGFIVDVLNHISDDELRENIKDKVVSIIDKL